MISLDVPIDDRDLLKAMSLRFCRHYPAMEVARMFGGSPSTPWSILEKYTPKELLDEARERQLDIGQLETAMAKCECCPRLVVESALFEKITTDRKAQ